jgi:ActR/RegA family two-component response regulator
MRERIALLTSATLTGFATIALASAATSTTPIDKQAYHARPANWSDIYCAPGTCTRVAKTPAGGPPSVLY